LARNEDRSASPLAELPRAEAAYDRFGTLQGLYDFFDEASALPGIAAPRLGAWAAWPAAKMYLYTELLGRIAAAGAGSKPVSGPGLRRVRARLDAGVAALRFLRHLSARDPAKKRPAIAWQVATFPSVGPDGTVRDAIFDELPARLARLGGQVSLGEAPPHGTDATLVPTSGLARAAARLATVLAPALAPRPHIGKVAEALATALAPLAAGCSLDPRDLRAALAAFEARRILWRLVFRRLRPRLLIITDAGFRAGEIAAAKECGIRVVEFQHGLFGPRCPDYGWPAAYRAHRAAMPVPDRLAVFGPVFRAAAIARGFWPEHTLVEVGNGTIDRFVASGSRSSTDRRPAVTPRVLFLTQSLNRAGAIAFWSDYAKGVEGGIFPAIELTIKIHPAEADESDAYRRLAGRITPHWQVAPATATTHGLIGEHDLIVSFTSNALIEAAALGRPAVSIACDQTPGGLLGLCPLPGLAGTIRTMNAPDELAALVAAPLPSPQEMRAALYAPDFLARAEAVIDGALAQGVTP
jgi:hypothetical protein